jgi:hypothetical protein
MKRTLMVSLAIVAYLATLVSLFAQTTTPNEQTPRSEDFGDGYVIIYVQKTVGLEKQETVHAITAAKLVKMGERFFYAARDIFLFLTPQMILNTNGTKVPTLLLNGKRLQVSFV